MRLLVLLSLCCSLCLVACGGDDEEPATAGSGGTEETSSGVGSQDWVKEVNAICTRNEKETQKLAAQAQEDVQATDEKLTAEIIERSVPLQEQLLGELGEIEPPEELAADYDAFLAGIGDGVDLFPQLAESIRSGKEDQELAAKFEEIANDTRPFAQEHGLDACIPDAG